METALILGMLKSIESRLEAIEKALGSPFALVSLGERRVRSSPEIERIIAHWKLDGYERARIEPGGRIVPVAGPFPAPSDISQPFKAIGDSWRGLIGIGDDNCRKLLAASIERGHRYAIGGEGE